MRGYMGTDACGNVDDADRWPGWDFSETGFENEIGKCSCSFCDAPAHIASPIGEYYCETCFAEINELSPAIAASKVTA